MKAKKIIDFIPFFALLAGSLTCLLIYLFAMNGRAPVRIIQGCAAPLVALIIPVLNLIFKIRIPMALNIAIAAFTLLGMDFAAVLDFYVLIPYFDKFLHTAFGTLGAFGTFVFLLYGKGEKMKAWSFFTVILLSVMGMAAFWEIYEYVTYGITGTDIQGWYPDMNAVGDMTVREFFKDYRPLWDTIWDIIVAGFGVAVFYILVLIDKLCGYKVCKSVYRQVNYRAVPVDPSPAEK